MIVIKSDNQCIKNQFQINSDSHIFRDRPSASTGLGTRVYHRLRGYLKLLNCADVRAQVQVVDVRREAGGAEPPGPGVGRDGHVGVRALGILGCHLG